MNKIKYHNDKGNAPFDPTNFDVDAFIVSNELAPQIKPIGNARWGNRFGPLKTIQKSIHQKLRSLFPGLKNGRDDRFQFRIFTEEEMQNFDTVKDPFTIIEGENK